MVVPLACCLLILAAVTGCRGDKPSRIGRTNGAGGSAEGKEPSTRECEACHSGSVRGAVAWDAAEIYPDLLGLAPFVDVGRDGLSQVVPVDTTLSEWRAAQALLVEGDAGFGNGCADCHGLFGEGPHHELAGRPPLTARASADLAERHQRTSTPPSAIENTFGLWVHGRTYRTLLVATVKVLNYGAGHRAPSGRGASVTLHVTAIDSFGEPLELLRGPRITDGRAQPGVLYARTFLRADGSESLGAEGAVAVARDTRLQAGEHDALTFTFLLPARARDSKPAWTIDAELRYQSTQAPAAGRIIESATTRAAHGQSPSP